MSQRKSIAWILDFTSKLPREEQIKCLRANDGTALRTILQYCFDPRVVWKLPPGAPPYTPNELPNQEAMLYSELRKLYLFIEGGNDNVHAYKRERLFIDMLEMVSPEDAELLCSIKEKKLPYPGLTADTVLEAYPGLF